MTSVVGILNKQGVAIAADSAVTLGRMKDGRKRQKISKNGNKMIRLSETVPVAVMITGNANYLHIPWEVIVRRYRQQRGTVAHSTVEDAVNDFFEFIHSDPVFWGYDCGSGYVNWLAEMMYNEIVEDLVDLTERDSEGNLCRPDDFVQSFCRTAASIRKNLEKGGICPQFKEYSLDQFQAAADDYFCEFVTDNYPEEVLTPIRQSLRETVWTALRTRCVGRPYTTLVFVGFGKDQDCPSLVSTVVGGGFDKRVNYHVRPEDIVCISDDKPVAICPFAQDDVISSVLRGIHSDWSEDAGKVFWNMVNPFGSDVFSPSGDEEDPGIEFHAMLAGVKTDDLQRQFYKEGMRMLDKNQRAWERTLKDSDLESLASLADCLIDLTGVHRVLTFSQEGVGGPVDVAVISKNEGFTWLRRKSWYHKDGPMGV